MATRWGRMCRLPEHRFQNKILFLIGIVASAPKPAVHAPGHPWLKSYSPLSVTKADRDQTADDLATLPSLYHSSHSVSLASDQRVAKSGFNISWWHPSSKISSSDIKDANDLNTDRSMAGTVLYSDSELSGPAARYHVYQEQKSPPDYHGTAGSRWKSTLFVEQNPDESSAELQDKFRSGLEEKQQFEGQTGQFGSQEQYGGQIQQLSGQTGQLGGQTEQFGGQIEEFGGPIEKLNEQAKTFGEKAKKIGEFKRQFGRSVGQPDSLTEQFSASTGQLNVATGQYDGLAGQFHASTGHFGGFKFNGNGNLRTGLDSVSEFEGKLGLSGQSVFGGQSGIVGQGGFGGQNGFAGQSGFGGQVGLGGADSPLGLGATVGVDSSLGAGRSIPGDGIVVEKEISVQGTVKGQKSIGTGAPLGLDESIVAEETGGFNGLFGLKESPGLVESVGATEPAFSRGLEVLNEPVLFYEKTKEIGLGKLDKPLEVDESVAFAGPDEIVEIDSPVEIPNLDNVDTLNANLPSGLLSDPHADPHLDCSDCASAKIAVPVEEEVPTAVTPAVAKQNVGEQIDPKKVWDAESSPTIHGVPLAQIAQALKAAQVVLGPQAPLRPRPGYGGYGPVATPPLKVIFVPGLPKAHLGGALGAAVTRVGYLVNSRAFAPGYKHPRALPPPFPHHSW